MRIGAMLGEVFGYVGDDLRSSDESPEIMSVRKSAVFFKEDLDGLLRDVDIHEN